MDEQGMHITKSNADNTYVEELTDCFTTLHEHTFTTTRENKTRLVQEDINKPNQSFLITRTTMNMITLSFLLTQNLLGKLL